MSSATAESTTAAIALEVRAGAHELTGAPADFEPLMALIGDAPYVLIGEASHGTHEFYRIRGEITKRLIQEHGFTAVAVEADWPDAYRVNRFVRGESSDADADVALSGFKRFPQWMWRNADVLDFVGWLRSLNESRTAADAVVGFYGLDLYSLHASIAAVLEYLDAVDPEAAVRARQRYACFENFGEDAQAYGYAATHGLAESCEPAVVAQLVEMRRSAAEYARRDGRLMRDALFYAEQNARLVKDAEQYYRAMFYGGVASWNLRDRHMAETLDALSASLVHQDAHPKIVVWAHNSHLGDARATEMATRGELNVGQLVRSRHGDNAVLVGFTTYTGTVTAANDWDSPAERRNVRPALRDSYEAVMHDTGLTRFFLNLREDQNLIRVLGPARLERAIGVIYRPETERQSHYFAARLPRQFDALFHYDVTRAVEPLERTGLWESGELPETYPSAL
jgi:erythromycin esterase-like protein